MTCIPTGYSEATSKGAARLRDTRWPPLLAGMILIPWMIGWSVFTPLVWASFLYDDPTWSSDGEPASLGDVLGFTFFWFFGFSLFCFLYLRRERYKIDAKRFERENGCSFLYFQTSALSGAITDVGHRTEETQHASSRTPRKLDYITLNGLLEQTLYLCCFGFKIPLHSYDRRVYEMLLDDRQLARYAWERLAVWSGPSFESTDPDYTGREPYCGPERRQRNF
ncbi:MAG: hypothetical protein AAF745_13285 [Planctomycetota bacterium]